MKDFSGASERVMDDAPARAERAPGKVALTARLQRRPRGTDATAAPPATTSPRPWPGVGELDDPFATHLLGRPVQREARAGGAAAAPDRVHALAAHGVAGRGDALPHREAIQRAFGPAHDVGAIEAFVGGAAASAAEAIGAEAYATGHRVAFRAGPDLHTAAHEAAHVVQQRAGVQLRGGVGEAGDAHERHADAVADRVVRGESAADLLAAYGGAGGGRHGVQKEERAAAPAAPSTYAGDERAPNLDDAEFLNEVAAALEREAQRLLESNFDDPSTDPELVAGRHVQAEVAKVRAAMGGRGDWRFYVEAHPWSTRDVGACVADVRAAGLAKGAEKVIAALSARVHADQRTLAAATAAVRTLAEATRDAEQVFADLETAFTMLEYLDKATSWAEGKGSPGRTGRGLGKSDDHVKEAFDPTAGAGGLMSSNPYETAAGLAEQIVTSGLARRLATWRAIGECYAAGEPDAKCENLVAGTEHNLRTIARVSKALARDVPRLQALR